MEFISKSIDDEKIRQYISYDESLYDLMCSLIGFEVATENKEFNSVILNGGLQQGNSIEITYSSNNEKNPFLYFLLAEILYMNYANANEAMPVTEVLFFDNYANLNIFTLHLILGNKLQHVDEKEREDIIRGLFKKLFIFRPQTKKDFILNLKSAWTLFDKNKFLRVVIIDSINSFQFFEDKRDNFDISNKDKKRMSINAKRNFNKEINTRIQENIQKIVCKEKLCTILFKREYFKMNDCLAWDEAKAKFCVNVRLSSHLNSKIYNTRKICLINFENISDMTLDILNKMARNDKNKVVMDRQPNLNIAIIKDEGQSEMALVVFSFSDLVFQVLNYFELKLENYYLMTRNENKPNLNG